MVPLRQDHTHTRSYRRASLNPAPAQVLCLDLHRVYTPAAGAARPAAAPSSGPAADAGQATSRARGKQLRADVRGQALWRRTLTGLRCSLCLCSVSATARRRCQQVGQWKDMAVERQQKGSGTAVERQSKGSGIARHPAPLCHAWLALDSSSALCSVRAPPLPLCTPTVYSLCVLPLCTPTVYSLCVLPLCTPSVYSLCVIPLCNPTVYSLYAISTALAP